jgi:hypothetical protein
LNVSEDRIPDIIPEDIGGRFDLIPDENGTILRMGDGIYRDAKTGHVFKRSPAGPKSKAIGEGKSVIAVDNPEEKARLKSRLMEKRKKLHKLAGEELAEEQMNES